MLYDEYFAGETGQIMDFGKAASYWTDREDEAGAMERGALVQEVEEFIAARNTCALATAGLDGFVRCTPIEYTYMDGAFWMLSEGGLKFRALESNRNVCLAIYDAYEGFGKLNGMQVMGRARIIEPWSDEYLALLAYKGIDAERLRKLPTEMHLIEVVPESIDLLCSSLKERGFDSRQHLELEG